MICAHVHDFPLHVLEDIVGALEWIMGLRVFGVNECMIVFLWCDF